MIPLPLISLAAKLGIPERFRKAAVVAAGITFLLLLAFAVVKIHDHNVIKAHDAKQDAATAKADRAADDHAAEQRRTDDARLTQETNQLNRSTSNGQTDLDRRLAFQRCLRMQQSARAAKRQPPPCN